LGLPVTIHTAYTQYKENFLTWAADDYIVKSLDFSDLNNSVKKLIVSGANHETIFLAGLNPPDITHRGLPGLKT
jgi:DNA-binding response OmpR family regulator